MSIGELKHSSRISVSHALLVGLLLFSANSAFAQGASAVAAAGASVAAGAEAKGDKKPDPKKDAANVAKGGTALKGTTNVRDNVNIQVVLLPRKQADRVFGTEIAKHYAVVQVIIDNKSEDAAFVLHSIFADYAGWALGGVPTPKQGNAALNAASTAAPTGGSSTPSEAAGGAANPEAAGASSSAGGPCPANKDSVKADAYQSVSCEGHVASVESRVIRGELQDASTWTLRNGLIRAAVLIGTVASGIPAFGSKNALKYVGAYNGQLVPGAQVFWPDETIPQVNRVSDFGFQTNKIFAKGDSDIVYAFFPLDRFFTPGIKKIFLNAPAVFFAPAQLFVDGRMGKLKSQAEEMKNLIEDLADPPIAPLCDKKGSVGSAGQPCKNQKERDQEMLRRLTTPCTAARAADPKTADATTAACGAQNLLNQISLNSANILVQGVMTVNVDIVPATITDISFDEGNSSSKVWTVATADTTATSNNNNKDHAATVTGSFLTGGVPGVASIEVPDTPDKPSTNISDYLDAQKGISVVSDGSTDTKLNFKIQWKKTIPSGSKLHFQVTKTDAKDTKKTSGVKSMDYVFPVTYTETPASK